MEVTETSPLPNHWMARNEDEISSANTEERLLSSRHSSETISSSNRSETYCSHFKRVKLKSKSSPWTYLICGTILTFLGVTLIIWTPFEIFMTERLRMRPGFPPFEWWKTPPDEVLLRIYIFNITNSEEFLSCVETKLHVEEVGPIVYMEKLIHSNITFNENGTMSYLARRTLIFLPEMNAHIDLNDTLTVPNLAVLGIASYLWDTSLFTKFGYNILLRSLESRPIVSTTIYNYLWNFSDPILELAQTVVPSLVPVKNVGILSRIYKNFENLVTVYMGTEHGSEKFFKIDKYDGSKYVPGFQKNPDCSNKVVNSTEGVAYQQFLTKNSTLLYWRKTICKVVELYFESEVYKYGVNAYRYVLSPNTFDRTFPSYLDCFIGNPQLPNGLAEISKCYYDFPMAASFPHFLYGDEILKTYVDGLAPDREKHESFVVVEPITGIPLTSMARSQSNLVIRELYGFNEVVDKFSDIIIPMFWAEYNQVGLPFYIAALMYFVAVILPYLQIVITTCIIGAGLCLTILSMRCLLSTKKRKKLVQNKTLTFEERSFVTYK